MISYELAKQLKMEGFLQGGKGDDLWDDSGEIDEEGHMAYAPTLDELIEACGERFGSLGRDWLDDVGRFWCAIDRGREQRVPPRVECTGSTPTEAVARLWLALNKGV
jgi:hypothetical protein